MTRWPPPPTLSASFFKGHGLGNDYLVFEEGDDWVANAANLRRVCDRHRGVGSDGIVVLLADGAGGRFGAGERSGATGSGRPSDVPASGAPSDAAVDVARLRMFNPDGSEFERSGNGLRVLASYVFRSEGEALGGDWPRILDVEVGGSRVRMVGHGRAGPTWDVSVEMGRARTGPDAVGLDRGVLDASGRLPGPDGSLLHVVPVRVGNPHVVVLCGDEAELSEERLVSIGPFVAEHPAIPDGANVQLALHDDGPRCRALIWERGVGRTEASGTSSCAVAVAMVSSGAATPGEITVRMPGGELRVTVDEELAVVLRGPVDEVADGRLAPAYLADLRG